MMALPEPLVQQGLRASLPALRASLRALWASLRALRASLRALRASLPAFRPKGASIFFIYPFDHANLKGTS